MNDIDILIVGGGLIGMSLMHSLSILRYRVHLVEANPVTKTTPSVLETRSIALSPSSIRIFKQLNLWSSLSEAAESIQTIHISEQGRFGAARLLSHQSSEPLGAVLEMNVLQQALKKHLNAACILQPAQVLDLDVDQGIVTLKTKTEEKKIRAQWVIAADGADSSIRRFCHAMTHDKVYSEHAIATNVALSRSHENIAYERFTPDGPLALLPLNGPHMALVWTLKPKQAETLKRMDEASFLKALQHTFGYRAGRMTAVGPRMTYPLKQVMMPKQVFGRVIFIGNAAHTLHPLAGQGFNLGLRDVAMLTECIAKNGLTDDTLIRYQTARKTDQTVIMRAIDGLVSLFKSTLPGMGLARSAGLVTLDNSTFFKNMVLKYAKGFGGIVPELVCGVSLDSMIEGAVCQM